MAKKRVRWNRSHEFARKKSTKREVGHPVYVYAKSGNKRKYLTFTHKPETGKEANYEKLKYNIDAQSNEPCYMKKTHDVAHQNKLNPPDKKYRIHQEDRETIKMHKK